MKWFVAVVLLALAAVLSFQVAEVTRQIQRVSRIDEAQPADAIIVLGAAEYRGRPSPVLEARLNHALLLYLKGLAPRVITTGGAGGDPVFTEGSVSRTYLAQHGVPPEAIVVEREGESTVQSVAAVAEIMRRMNLKSAIVVSDGYHIFRVKKMLESSGLKVYGSPRPSTPEAEWKARWQDIRQAVGYLLWKIGIPV
ncbi:MAG TPA: YdcF family protein [Bryobacteraceae bacterium]|nr:YdcF family protein [Bryobacteraceae bacterium]